MLWSRIAPWEFLVPSQADRNAARVAELVGQRIVGAWQLRLRQNHSGIDKQGHGIAINIPSSSPSNLPQHNTLKLQPTPRPRTVFLSSKTSVAPIFASLTMVRTTLQALWKAGRATPRWSGVDKLLVKSTWANDSGHLAGRFTYWRASLRVQGGFLPLCKLSLN